MPTLRSEMRRQQRRSLNYYRALKIHSSHSITHHLRETLEYSPDVLLSMASIEFPFSIMSDHTIPNLVKGSGLRICGVPRHLGLGQQMRLSNRIDGGKAISVYEGLQQKMHLNTQRPCRWSTTILSHGYTITIRLVHSYLSLDLENYKIST